MSRIYVALDLETTGLSPEHDSILEIGAVKFRAERVLETWSSLVNPQRAIPYKIIQLTGITQEEVDNAPTFSSLTGSLSRFVGKCPVIGHNISFDLNFLKHQGLILKNPYIDTFELASILIPHASRYSLNQLAQALGISFQNQHRALEDAMAAKELFLALFQRAMKLDMAIIEEINRLASRVSWPLGYLFREVERAKSQEDLAGSIGQQLLAKGLMDGDGSLRLLSRSLEEEPLRPLTEKEPLDIEALCATFEGGGTLASHIPVYEPRPSQVEMARAVAGAFNESRHLLVEAGTGTGRALGYLLPAIYFAARNGERVVIATGAAERQRRLLQEDIPALQKILPFEFRASFLRKPKNYLCLQRLADFREQDSLSAQELTVLAKILAWLPGTVTGDRTELFLPALQENLIWEKVCAEKASCLAERCSYRKEGKCFFYRALQQAERAHLLFVNHALLLDEETLPDYRYLIVDEAHRLESSLTSGLGFAIDLALIEEILRELDLLTAPRPRHKRIDWTIFREFPKLKEETGQTKRKARALFEALAYFLEEYSAENSEEPGRKLRLTEDLRARPAWAQVMFAGDKLCASLDRLGRGLEKLKAGEEELQQDIIGRANKVHTLSWQLQAILLKPLSKFICWMQKKDEEISLHAAPLHVGELIRKHLLDTKESVVFTSSTLHTEGCFDFIRERLGIWEADELVLNSPFDYASSTLLYLPTDIPEPNQSYYQKKLEETITSLCRAVGGHTLVLFTAHSQVHNTARAVAGPLAEEGILLYQQGDGSSRSQLLENFRAAPRAVLLDMQSFWEGADLSGMNLNCLVIAKLPFLAPRDPIFAARSERFDDPFLQYSVPEAILRFRQGFEHLIRRRTDRGVVAVLDSRLLKKSYGQAFLNSLPPCTVRRGPLDSLPLEAARWLERN